MVWESKRISYFEFPFVEGLFLYLGFMGFGVLLGLEGLFVPFPLSVTSAIQRGLVKLSAL